MTLVMVYIHIGVGKPCVGVQQGGPSTNVAKLCHPPRTCVKLDVDHGAAYTYNWICPIYHGPIGGCVEWMNEVFIPFNFGLNMS